MREREREREKNVLFNDTLDTFYLRVKNLSDSKRGSPLLPLFRGFFPISSTIPHDITYHSLCYTSCREIAQRIHHDRPGVDALSLSRSVVLNLGSIEPQGLVESVSGVRRRSRILRLFSTIPVNI